MGQAPRSVPGLRSISSSANSENYYNSLSEGDVSDYGDEATDYGGLHTDDSDADSNVSYGTMDSIPESHMHIRPRICTRAAQAVRRAGKAGPKVKDYLLQDVNPFLGRKAMKHLNKKQKVLVSIVRVKTAIDGFVKTDHNRQKQLAAWLLGCNPTTPSLHSEVSANLVDRRSLKTLYRILACAIRDLELYIKNPSQCPLKGPGLKHGPSTDQTVVIPPRGGKPVRAVTLGG